MRNLRIVVLMMAMIVWFASPSFAVLRKDLATIKGKITYINAARNEVTVKDDNTGKEVTFTAKVVDATVYNGSAVMVMYKVGTHNATSVRLVQVKKAKGLKAAPAPAPIEEAPVKKSSWY